MIHFHFPFVLVFYEMAFYHHKVRDNLWDYAGFFFLNFPVPFSPLIILPYNAQPLIRSFHVKYGSIMLPSTHLNRLEKLYFCVFLSISHHHFTESLSLLFTFREPLNVTTLMIKCPGSSIHHFGFLKYALD